MNFRGEENQPEFLHLKVSLFYYQGKSHVYTHTEFVLFKYGGQFTCTLPTPLIKPNFCILHVLPHRRSTTVSLETTAFIQFMSFEATDVGSWSFVGPNVPSLNESMNEMM